MNNDLDVKVSSNQTYDRDDFDSNICGGGSGGQDSDDDMVYRMWNV